ncbi:hypothetical protein [Flavobacterium sp. XS2P39]|uniref:hypothetical protein n=1 Tax=Flavobacterium sp. XS2P39 TaxID=3401725 RepID=UPI003AAD370E
MKKAKSIYWILSIFLLTLYSCSNDSDDSVKLLKKVIETSENGTSVTTLFTYDGDKIVTTDGVGKHTDFSYTDGLISKIVTLDKTSQFIETIEYTYIAGELVRAKSLNNYIINYIHNSDETVSYEKLAINAGSQQVKMYHGILYFQNENLIRDERILDNTAPGVLSKYSVSFEYDSKYNPLFNILGYKKLLELKEAISSNNSLISTVITSVSKDDQITSSATFYRNSFTYDFENYPTELVTENARSDNGNTGYLKSQYFY